MKAGPENKVFSTLHFQFKVRQQKKSTKSLNKVFSTLHFQFKVQQQKKSTKSLIKVQCKLRVENTLFSRYASEVSNVYKVSIFRKRYVPTDPTFVRVSNYRSTDPPY